MGRGRGYTKDEDDFLKALHADFGETFSYTDLALKAQEYQHCKERGVNALAQHISALVNPSKTNDEPEENVSESDLLIDSLEMELKKLNAKYESLINCLLKTSTKIRHGYLQWEFWAITGWFKENESKRYYARVEELETEGEA